MGKKESSLVCDLVQRCCLFCFAFVFLGVRTNCQNQTCNQGDLKALQGFLRALETGVEGWSLDASSDCCAWPGVSCNNSSLESRGRVISLELQSKRLKGYLSDSLGDLDHLQLLNLSANSLKGTVPSRLLSLLRLEQLDLSMNNLSGSVQHDLYLPSIQVFNVSYNALDGSHPIFNGSRNLVVYDVSFNRLSGGIDSAICNSSAKIKILRFSMNNFSGKIPGFGNCRWLEELFIDLNEMVGGFPEDLFKLSSLRKLNLLGNQLSGPLNTGLGNLPNLELLDLSFNSFSGNISDVFGRLRRLECLSLQSNNLTGSLPPSLSNLPSLRVLNMRNNFFDGEIALNCMIMTHLSSLDLTKNNFHGPIPSDLSRCSELKTLNLARNNLSGELPISFRNLTSLAYLSLSGNSLSNLSSALGILQDVSSLNVLVLTKTFNDNQRIPTEGIQGFRNLQLLAIASCGLSGQIPSWLENCSKLKVLDLSWNNLNGTIPSWLGNFDNLFYLDLSNNSLTGEIPENLLHMKALISDNISDKEPSEYFPFIITRNGSGKGLQYNQVSSFPPSIILCYNMLVGPILPAFGNLRLLLVLDLSNNKLSGSIPDELSGMSSLETLDLSYNNLSGSIPSSLTKLYFLSKFNVAYNNLVGPIPSGSQFSTFSSSDFEGNPGLCGDFRLKPCTAENSGPVVQQRKNKGVIIGMAIGIGLGMAFLLVIVFLFVSRTRYRRRKDAMKAVADSNHNFEIAGSQLVLLFQEKDKELTISDILKSTNHFDQDNIIGCGGFGLVYKAALADGRKVAIKRLSGDFGQMEREFQAEIETLSRAQHENLVLLQGYCKIGNDRLLIYSYMENGSLDYWLHEKIDGGIQLDWKKRLRIAQGTARGLEYLHQACDPHILHRDIKSSNILLDVNFEPHLADFGLARLILPYDTHVTTDLVGTLGYIPPEYAQSSVATFKGDVYSFGVVLLELLTGKRPVDMCKPKGGRELISWVFQMKNAKRENDVFDLCIYDEVLDHQLRQMLEIACLCLNDSPKLRPGTKELVAWLENIDMK